MKPSVPPGRTAAYTKVGQAVPPVGSVQSFLRFPKIPLTALLLLALCAAAEPPAIRMESGAFKVAGWNPSRSAPRAGWSSIFAVYAADGDAPPILGAYTIENNSLVFRPRFPLSAGVRARAIFHPPHGSPIEAVFESTKAD